MSSLRPRRWPVRWRIAGVSAALTFVILVCFALVVGQLAADRMRDDFRDELESSANQLADGLRIESTLSGPEPMLDASDLRRMSMTSGGFVRIVDEAGRVIAEPPNAPDFGPPAGDIERRGEYEVATAVANTLAGPLFVQYARSADSIDATIERLWLFLAGGVLGGTMLATLAGLAVAMRAMAPIAGLTAAAREIAATRDPSRRLPEPGSDDEVGELAATLGQMLRQLDAARAETEQMIQAQREFVADASHELRTPLTSILANLELLQERLEAQAPDGDEAEIVPGALGSSRRMRRLVSDLLVLARADAGRTGPRRSCDLVEIAAMALAELRPVAGEHRLELSSSEPVPVRGNPDDLHRLAANLLANAVRHTPPGTSVEISVRREGEVAVLEVSDDGPGLPQELGEGIFARFVRGAGPADTSADAGTGLGLAIVQAVAGSHGGTVEAGSSPRGGARFTIRLPLEAAARPRAAVSVA